MSMKKLYIFSPSQVYFFLAKLPMKSLISQEEPMLINVFYNLFYFHREYIVI